MGLITIILLIAALLGIEHTINQDNSVYSKIRKTYRDRKANFKEFESRDD